MTEQTRVDPEALRTLGSVFGQTAASVHVAATELVDCDFGAHMGNRYGTHAMDYAAGILAVTQSVNALVGSSRTFGDALTAAADTLAGQDSSNAAAATFVGGDPGRVDG
ncbi:type VII secretion target [Williamsia sp. 1135]|uniref:type VII secretion target n=1 Tax=Williamsia sp. 1135 TaxID=1889262 RepID=UPI000A119684|nr:type VII secretion target [Williamsia sp. 1135]